MHSAASEANWKKKDNGYVYVQICKKKVGGGWANWAPVRPPLPVPTVMGSKFNLRYRIYITSNETKDL